MPSFDILMASYQRADILEKCLLSISDDVNENLKNIIILSLDSDNLTQEVISKFKDKLPIEHLKVPNRLRPGASRNRLIDQSSAEYLCFLDDDSMVTNGYFKKCTEIIEANTPDIFGGPDQSPEDGDIRQRLIGEIISHPLVMGPTYKRHSVENEKNLEASETIVTLCNMWIKKSILEENKLRFDESLKRCEENQLLEELKLLGFTIQYYPEIYIFHHRRVKIIDIAKVQFWSGYFRSVCFFMNKETFKFFFAAPLITGFLIILLPIINFKLFSSFAVIHSLLTIFVLLKIWKKFPSLYAIIWSWIATITIHLFFSLGMAIGFVLGWKNEKQSED